MIKLSPRTRSIGKYAGVAIVASIGTMAALIAVQTYYRAEEVAIVDAPVLVEPKPMPIITNEPGVTYTIEHDTITSDSPDPTSEFFTGWVSISYMPEAQHEFSRKSQLWSVNCRKKSGSIESSMSVRADDGKEIKGLDVSPRGLSERFWDDGYRQQFPPGSVEAQIINSICIKWRGSWTEMLSEI